MGFRRGGSTQGIVPRHGRDVRCGSVMRRRVIECMSMLRIQYFVPTCKETSGAT